jgi:uncharacterized protein (TIGR03437 family)
MKFARSMVLAGLFICNAAAQQPTVNQNGVVNSASYVTANPPGSLVTIFGTNMASTKLLIASTVPLSTHLKGGSEDVSATVNGTPAPMYYAVSTQSSVQVPWSVKAGTATIVVTRNGTSSPPQAMQVATFSPGIFTVTQNGVGMALAFNAVAITVNGKPTLAIAQPAGSTPGLTAIPAKAGDHLFVYATGLGPVTPAINDGSAPCALSGCKSTDRQRTTTTQPQVLVGGVSAHIEFSGLAPQYVGVYQLQFTMPAGVTPDNAVPLQIKIGGAESDPAKVTIAVQ